MNNSLQVTNHLRCLAACFIFLFLTANVDANTVPIEYFSQLPDVRDMHVSPSGEKIASIIRVDTEEARGTAVQILNVQTKEKKIALFADNTTHFIDGISWKDNKLLLVEIHFPLESNIRITFIHSQLLVVDTISGEVHSIERDIVNIVDSLPHDPEHILFSVGSPDGLKMTPGSPQVIKLNIKTGRKKVVQRARTRVHGWMTDRQHEVRAGTYLKDSWVETVIKDADTGKWLNYWRFDRFSKDRVLLIGFGLDPNIVYLQAYNDDRLAIFKVNLKDKNLKRELVYSDVAFDIRGHLVYSPKSNDVVGITFSENGGTVFFDPELEELQRVVDGALPERRNFIYSFSENLEKYLVFSSGPQESGTYFIGSSKPTKLDAIAYSYKNLPPDVLHTVKHVEYTARDGLKIDGYLTLPKGKAVKLPTILFPHGGPISRDNNSFDYWAQYFASKGYAVLQMNFRGSDGKGLKFRNAGLQKWGKEMQEDIEDGAQFLVRENIADPKSICIVGASYGGYAALMGVSKTPDLYKCAISFAGLSDLVLFTSSHRDFRNRFNLVDAMIGKGRNNLKEISPINFVDKIKTPILLIHGDLDYVVGNNQSINMYEALIAAKKDVTYLEQAGGDHFLSSEQQRMEAFKAMGEFLDKHLPVN